MAISWGSYNGHLRVGIDVSQSPSKPSNSTTSVRLTVRYYVGTDGWDFADNQTLNLTRNITGTADFYNGLTGGSMRVATRTITVPIYYNSRPSRDFGAWLSGAYNGASPSKVRGYRAPYRPAAAPSAPGRPSVNPADDGDSARITWSAPSSTNGASVDKYQIQVDNNSNFSSPVLNYQRSNRAHTTQTVSPGGTYYARVRAHNSAGWSSWSATRSFTTPARTPDQPARPSISNATANSASLTWTAPDDNGVPIAEYQVALSTASSFSPQWTYTFSGAHGRTISWSSGLTRATTYYARVRARNSVGWSSWSATRSWTTDATVPSPPTRLRATSLRQTGVTFTWSPPADSGGSTAAGFDLQYAPDADFADAETIHLSATARTYLLGDGLLPGTRYWARIRAQNSIGWSDWSTPIEFRTAPSLHLGTASTWAGAQVLAGNGTDWVLCEVLTGDGTSWN